MRELFDQHPLPWVVDDNRLDHEGDVTVFDANGTAIICTGNMEDCTWADILLARLIAQTPALLAACEATRNAEHLAGVDRRAFEEAFIEACKLVDRALAGEREGSL